MCSLGFSFRIRFRFRKCSQKLNAKHDQKSFFWSCTNLSKTPILAWGADPCQVSVMGVRGHTYNLGAQISELIHAVTEPDDLRRAHEGEIKRVEEQDSPYKYKY